MVIKPFSFALLASFICQFSFGDVPSDVLEKVERNSSPVTLLRPLPEDIPTTVSLEILIYNYFDEHMRIPSPEDVQDDRRHQETSTQHVPFRVAMAVFEDGTIYSSQDRINGGGAFFKSSIDPQSIEPIKRRIIEIMAQGPAPGLAYQLDSSHVIVDVNGRYVEYDTCHFLFERNNPGFKNPEKGVYKEVSYFETSTENEIEYAESKKRWEDIRAAAFSLCPNKGTLVFNLRFHGVELNAEESQKE